MILSERKAKKQIPIKPPTLVQRMHSKKLKSYWIITRGKVAANLKELNNMVSKIGTNYLK
jgi:hypothetical protein